MAYYRELIETLAAKRRAQGLSQEALSQIMGVSEGMVAKWETGHKMPSCFGLMCWCQALEVRVSLAA